MLKIRLRRIGTKGRPFYRVVVAKSAAGRNGAFVETIGQYDPIVKPTLININSERALHWLLQGAQPTETTAFLLNKVGVLEQFFEQRPAARKKFSFLDKRTAAISVASAVPDAAVAAAAETVEAAPVEPAPVEVAAAEPAPAEAAVETEPTPEPAAEAAPETAPETADAEPAATQA
jgi:small subunit ribosomal protein S16